MVCTYTKSDKMKALLLFLLGVLFLHACITSKAPAVTYRSDDYVILKLEHNETPDDLAQSYLGTAAKDWLIEAYNPGISFKEHQTVVIPLKDTGKGGIRDNGYQTVPILCYHQFGEKCASKLCIDTDLFAKQMEYLYDNGFTVVSLSDLIDFQRYKKGLPPKSVVITIDDGYQSVYTYAYPILKKYHFTATLFIYTNYINIGKAMSWEQLAELKKNGFEIGSHTVSHADLTRMKDGESHQAYLARIRNELFQSKKLIDTQLNQNTDFIAFPYGKYNYDVVDLCKQAGYKGGLLVKRGSNPFYADPFTLKRNMIIKRDMDSFKAKIKTFHKISLN